MRVEHGYSVELFIVGIGTTVGLKQPGDPSYTVYHTTTAAQERVRVVGPVDVEITGATFWTSASGVKGSANLASGGDSPATSPEIELVTDAGEGLVTDAGEYLEAV